MFFRQYFNFIKRNTYLRQEVFSSLDLSMDKIRLIGNNPENCLFSSLIRDKPDKKQAIILGKEFGVEFVNNQESSEFKQIDKSPDFKLSNQSYIDFQKKSPHGRVNTFQYKNTKFTLIGTQYEFIPIKNIYKMLRYSSPDLIYLQLRPDQVLNNFIINKKNQKTGFFSSSLYFQQIMRKGYEIMPSSLHRKKVKQQLQQNNIILKPMSEQDQQYYNEYKENVQKQYKPYVHYERLSLDAIATICFYAERNNIPIVLCDLPEFTFRQNIANSNTLMQLQNMFTRCSRLIATYPDLQFQTPLTMAYLIYPHIFLEHSDKYISTLLEYAIALKKYKNITAFLGYTQSESVEQFLEFRNVSHLADELQYTLPQNSIIKDISCQEIIEKHSLLDVMFYGKNIFDEFNNLEFKTTYEIIKMYADPEFVDQSQINKMRKFHYEMLQKYQTFAQKEYELGRKQLSKEFMKKVGY